jgi:hypothetical protein
MYAELASADKFRLEGQRRGRQDELMRTTLECYVKSPQ